MRQKHGHNGIHTDKLMQVDQQSVKFRVNWFTTLGLLVCLPRLHDTTGSTQPVEG